MGHTLRILSANLLNGAADPNTFAELVSGLEADVVAVQEIAPDQAEALSGVLPCGEIAASNDFHGMGIALRRPAEISRLPLGFRDAHVARLGPADWPDLAIPVEIVNVHIAAPHISPPGSGFFRRRQQIHLLEAYLINGVDGIDRVNGEECFDHSQGGGHRPAQVLIGDFNATPIWPLYRRISSHLTDAACAAAAKRAGTLGATWGPWPGAPKLLRIDHGFVRGLDVEEFHVVDIPGSDHSAIVMDLVLKPPARRID